MKIKKICASLLLCTALSIACLFSANPVQASSLNSLINPLSNSLIAGLPPGNAITDGRALLRYSLPIDNKEIRQVQDELEGISNRLRSKRWGPIQRDASKAERILARKRDAILASIPADRKAQAESLLDSLSAGIEPLKTAAENKDKEGVWTERKQLLNQVGEIEELMVDGYPFEVPAEYDNLPQLKGRATVEFTTDKGNITVVADGYSAPVTAGNFIDLVNKKFYDGLPFIRAEDFYVLQTGDPEGKDEGYIDPKTKEYRAIPMEILVKDDEQPIYGSTLEELGRFMDTPVLPFNSYGSLALARPGDNNNGGSSQFFFFLFEAELTPAGRNLLDGRYAVFGYTIDGKDVLRNLSAGDKIISARVVDGLDNLIEPKA
ncbi:MAG: peptidylprolyl isomerase [Leptolyngbya foveolarum]|uniref:peptidylprolyl isomerase n=1 Tax=Leptolyngbya foveolarum TaxID=47253 RepID=A0A2W4UGY2_9CYAN|nr:MAG: peptidylprolyl isomerase [Leptolyngbya foveolarum]